MNTTSAFILALLVSLPGPLLAQAAKQGGEQPRTEDEARSGDTWTKVVSDRAQRAKLHDASQTVRGDSGRWQDQTTLVHAAPIAQKPAKMPLDDWTDQARQRAAVLKNTDDNWLLFRTRQLDDNDRVWVQSIERRGNQFTILIHEAIWQGKYQKNFTYYEVLAVNLGKLEPGKYEAKCVIQPLVFNQLDGPVQPRNNWPKDERPAQKPASELRAAWTVAAGEKQALFRLESADRLWAASDARSTPSFVKHVVPLFNKVGCSNRTCHGAFQGQGGFQLSLFGYDPAKDYQQLKADGGRGLRVDPEQVDQSLILRKPLGKLDHGGEQVLHEGSWQHNLLRRWIAAAAPYQGDAEPYLARLEVSPQALRLAEQDSGLLRVIAHFTDGTREEVTALATFASNNDGVAEVNDAGHVTATGKGDTAVAISYGGGVVTCPVIVPFDSGQAFPEFPPRNRIDEHVAAKLRRVGIHPSSLSSDEQFLRRVYIDLIGTLPTPEEVRDFLADSSIDKRTQAIDRLLDRPEYSIYWASIFSDWTGNNGGNLNPAHKLLWLWHDWLRDKLARNLPYDELIGGILTATSREGRSLDELQAEKRTVSEKIQPRTGFDDGTYAKRKTLDLFWMKRTSDLTKELANRTAANFLGVQIQCAECHKHPFDRWTQADFEGFTSFFRVAGQLANLDGTPFNQGSRDYDKAALYLGVPGNERNNLARHPPKILAGPVVGYAPDSPDPRVALWQWMRSPENPYFARNLVNRLWQHYFSVGIVDPVDDMNAANPPSNPELLDWLAQDFIDHHFDLKHVHRVIANSRTYQLSHLPNPTNRLDRRNFSHALVKRMPAEVALDAVAYVTGTKLVFSNYAAPPDTRAIGLAPPERFGRSEYFMDTFGRPPRREICSCERSSDPALAQALYLINDEDIHSRIADPKGRLPRLLGATQDNARLVEELYLTALSRAPTPEEAQKALAYVQQAPSRDAGFQDLLWTLLNVREFLFVR